MFRHDRTDRDEPYPFLGGHHHHRQRVYHQRLSSDRFRQWRSHCRKLLGQVQDHLPDGHDLPDDRQLPAAADPYQYHYVDRTDPHRGIFDRLPCEE